MRGKVTSNEQIMDAALAIALREGVDQVSVRKLAKECGIGVGSMYNYYPDKQALMAAVTQRFWEKILEDQDKLFYEGMGFTVFLEQYYGFLYGRLCRYDKSWLSQIGEPVRASAQALLLRALNSDSRVDLSIWNMELNQDTFTEYVFTNLTALLQAGETHCRFFIFLLEHLLYR